MYYDMYDMRQPNMEIMKSPFLRKLSKLKGKEIRVGTICSKCTGVLKGIYGDYIVVLEKDGVKRNIRIDTICCVAEQ